MEIILKINFNINLIENEYNLSKWVIIKIRNFIFRCDPLIIDELHSYHNLFLNDVNIPLNNKFLFLAATPIRNEPINYLDFFS